MTHGGPAHHPHAQALFFGWPRTYVSVESRVNDGNLKMVFPIARIARALRGTRSHAIPNTGTIG